MRPAKNLVDMQNILDTLNEKQREAAQIIDGPILVVAGPGSGKTKLLTSRIAYLISQGIKPENILAVTFTNKATDEMRERIRNLLKIENYKLKIVIEPHVGTFHSICSKILRKEIEILGYNRNFAIYDEGDQSSLIKKILGEFDLDMKKFNPSAILGRISNLKNELVTPEAHEKMGLEFFDSLVNRVYFEYQKKLKQNNALDFDDLIMMPVMIFKEHPEILESYQDKFKYILVDEFQDTNKANYIFTRLLTKKHQNILVVGDDAQGIFSWRGADISNILDSI